MRKALTVHRLEWKESMSAETLFISGMSITLDKNNPNSISARLVSLIREAIITHDAMPNGPIQFNELWIENKSAVGH